MVKRDAAGWMSEERRSQHKALKNGERKKGRRATGGLSCCSNESA
jgi:hypothetical protein